MKFYLISDNVDTEMGLRLVGIEGEVVHKRRDFLEVLETKMKDRIHRCDFNYNEIN